MTSSPTHPLGGLLALVAAVALAAVLVGPAHAKRRAQAKTCDVSALSGRLGSTSVSSLKVLRTRCDTGIVVVRAFHACRLANGTQGRCVRKVRGFACGEIRTNTPVQFSSRVTCTKDRASVVHRYTQVL